MLVIDNNDLNILNLYIAIKNNGCSTNLIEKNIKSLKLKGVSHDEIIKLGNHENCRATYCPGQNTFYYDSEQEVLNRSKNHELVHCSSTNVEKLNKSIIENYKGTEYIPVSGIFSVLPGGLSFGQSLNEGLTEFVRCNLVPDINETYGIYLHPAYREMISAIILIMTVIGFKDTFEIFFNNDCYKFYETMEKHFGNKWYKIIFDCDTSFDYQIKYNKDAKPLIKDLLSLKYQFDIINGAYKNCYDKLIDNEMFYSYFENNYPENDLCKRIIDHKIKTLKKKLIAKKKD